MEGLISPKYQLRLAKDISEAIWAEYKSYREVEAYIGKWHIEEEFNNYWQNFHIRRKPTNEIDLLSTLNNIDGVTLLKIAVDLGVDTPDFIPSVATFRNDIKSEFKTASLTFEKALRQIESHPDIAIGLANSALESIIKEILKDDRILNKGKPNDTLYDLTSNILKEFKIFPNSDIPLEIKALGSSLLGATKAIETLRSNSTSFHGKIETDYLINDPLYTYFIVNSVTTVGLFLKTYYKLKLPKAIIENYSNDDDLPF
jgi:hypothetical protein